MLKCCQKIGKTVTQRSDCCAHIHQSDKEYAEADKDRSYSGSGGAADKHDQNDTDDQRHRRQIV